MHTKLESIIHVFTNQFIDIVTLDNYCIYTLYPIFNNHSWNFGCYYNTTIYT